MQHVPRVGVVTIRAAVAVSLVVLGASCGKAEEESNASPLNAIFGEPETPAESRAKQLEIEEAVAQCMKDEGWEYVPVDWQAQFNDVEELDYSAPDFGEKYGFGIVRNYEIYEWPYIDEDGNYVDGGPFGGGEEFVDPNADYRSSLSPEENQQYEAALYGEPMEAFSEAGDGGAATIPVQPLEDQGCYGKAQQEVYGDQPWNDQEFNDRMTQIYEDLENDPRIEDAEIAWSDCMYEIDAEYDFLDPNEIYQYFDKVMAEAKGYEIVETDPNTGEIIGKPGEYPEGGGYSTPDGESYGYVGKQRKITEARLRELQAEEIALWKTDQGCQKESDYQELRRQIEQELVDSIREEFPQYIQSDGA